MKKVLFFMMMALMSFGAQAQSVDGQIERYPVYCNVMGYNFLGVGKVKVVLDLGRNTNTKGFDSIYNPDGKKMKFNTMMDVLNYMSKRGWRCVDNYFISEGKGQVIHYLMEKWVATDAEITEGLLLKEEVVDTSRSKEDVDGMYFK